VQGGIPSDIMQTNAYDVWNLRLILCGAFIQREIYITLQLYGLYVILNMDC